MGLDMYLYKKTYVKRWDFQKAEELYNVQVTKNNQLTHIKSERVSEVIEDVMYWRKSNQIHKWFVDNVQEGVDDCGDYSVSRARLHKLLEVVQLTLRARHLAPGMLPTQSGFFFGGTEYDEYYWQDLEATEKGLVALLAEPDVGDYFYHSSW